MPEETTPDPGNSVAADAAQINWDSDDNPYKKRHADTQSAYTQGQQRLRELEALEQDPNAYLELGKKQGWIEVEEPVVDHTVDPEIAAMRQELADHREWRQTVQQQMQAEQQAAGMQLFHDDLDAWATEAGTKLSGADHAAIYGTLMQSPDPTQEQHAKAAFEAHVAHKQAERAAIEAEVRESLKRPRVPHIPGGGGADTGVPDFSEMTEKDALAWQVERARGIAAQ